MTRAGVLQDGRRKAYRPLPLPERLRAFADALDAWDRGDYFEAHELLEPAWMGTRDAAERDLSQGLIKLAAAFVHEVRGNRAGVAKNLVGADRRLSRAAEPSAARSTANIIASTGLVEPGDLVRDIHALQGEIARQALAPTGETRLSPPRLRHPSGSPGAA